MKESLALLIALLLPAPVADGHVPVLPVAGQTASGRTPPAAPVVARTGLWLNF